MTDGTGEHLELYKLAVDMADRISSRRGTANAFFLTLQTALVAFTGLVPSAVSGKGGAGSTDIFTIVLVALVGLMLSGTWWLLLRSYRDLNEAKFKVILELEKGLRAQPFGDEWGYLKQDPVKKKFPARYAELNVIERVVPIMFGAVYLAIGLRPILV